MQLVLSFILLFSTPVVVEPGTEQVELNIRQMEFFEDRERKYTFEQVLDPDFQFRFRKNLNFRPQDYNIASVYWVKVQLEIPESQTNYLVEFFDQTIDSLNVYLRHESEPEFRAYFMGDFRHFSEKPFHHKNFEITLPKPGKYTLYFRVWSHEYADIRIAIRSYNWFLYYALHEYFLYGIMYGMILIISLYNILIYSAIREEKYLYYTFYIISVGVFAMSVDGIAYQFLWPGSPAWNQVAHGVALFMVIFWAILFSKKFLNLRIRAPRLNRILDVVLALRIGWFLYCLFFNTSLFEYRQVELVPLTIIFAASFAVYNRGYKPARFFIVAFGFIFIGFLIRAMLSISLISFSTVVYYSLHICFVFEMLFLSFALSDRVRILKNNRDRAMRRIITQHEENARMKDRMNSRLEQLVSERTHELQEKNELLQQQKLEIAQINSLLDLDNYRLRNNIKSIQMERIQNKELTYAEFHDLFATAEDCLQALIVYKWGGGFQCHKCANATYSTGNAPLSRRCTKCGYQESPTTHTIFHGLKFPIQKAFYILYETLNKEQYSLSEMAEILQIRKNTILDFKRKIKQAPLAERERFNEIFANLEPLPQASQK